MALELSTDQKRDVILAAFNTAGPGADDGQVAAQVTRILNSFEDGSPAMNAFARADKRAEITTDVKSFKAEVIYVDSETLGDKPSNRPIVFLRTQVSDFAPQGIEVVRLDRLDSQDSEAVKALANQAVSLVGHTVGVTIAIEKTAGKQNARILRALEDRGAGAADIANLTNAEGWKLIDWEKGGTYVQQRQAFNFAVIAPRLSRLAKYRAAAMQPA